MEEIGLDPPLLNLSRPLHLSPTGSQLSNAQFFLEAGYVEDKESTSR